MESLKQWLVSPSFGSRTTSNVYFWGARWVSSAIRFLVTESAVMFEPAGEPLPLPGLLNGRLSQPGESDLDAFQASEGQEFSFHVSHAENFDPRLMPLSCRGVWSFSSKYLRSLGRARRIAPTSFEWNLAGERRRALLLDAVANGVSEPSLAY